MNINKKSAMKLLSAILCTCLLGSGIGAIAYAAGAARADSQTNASKTTKGSTAPANSSTEKALVKEESVYIIAGADGTAQKVIVSDWIQNGTASPTIRDKSTLKGVTVTKGDTSYTMDGDNMRVWDAAGEDVYYQGESSGNLPVSLSVRYQLDGKDISPQELAGKDGRVTIRFDYENNQYETVEINGKEEKIYVPFAVLTGLMLDNDRFQNVQVSNGKLINDGDRTIVAGLALPGLAGNLALNPEKLELPDYVEITADVTDFSLATTLTIATNEVFNQSEEVENSGKIEELDDLTASLGALTDAMNQLLDGSSQLYDGLATLLSKSNELIAGVNQLAEGAKQLSDGAGQLNQGAGELDSGASQLAEGAKELAEGLGTLTSNNATLNGGARQVFESLLSMADSQLAAAGLTVEKLTISNYAAVLNGVMASLNEETLYKMAYNTAYSKVEAAVRANADAVSVQVETAVRARVLEGVLAASGQEMTAEEYQAAVSSGLISPEIQAQISAAVEAQMADGSVQQQIKENTEKQIQNLIDQQMRSAEVTQQIEAAVESGKAGASSIASLKAQLDDYNQFYQGLLSYTAGVAEAGSGASQLRAGASELKEGASSLHEGTSSLKDGAGELYDGVQSLKDGSQALINGVSKLKDGAMQLRDGLKELNEKGVQKLVEAVEGEDIGNLAARLQATIDVSKDYRSFSGISDGMDGSVKFLYKTAGI